MRLASFVLVCLLLVCGTAGCVSDKAFFDAQEATWQFIGPQYRAYVTADATLTPEQREARLGTAALEDQVLAAHRKVIYGE